MKKQTAANNQTLLKIKRMVNDKIYKHCVEIANGQRNENLEDYLKTFGINLSEI